MTDPLSDLEVEQLRAFLNRPTPTAVPPITIGPFTSVPAPGSPIRSDWAQDISTYVANNVAIVANAAALAAHTPPNGARAVQLDTGQHWLRIGGAWRLTGAGQASGFAGTHITGSAQSGISAGTTTAGPISLGTAAYPRMVLITYIVRLDTTASTGSFRARIEAGGSILAYGPTVACAASSTNRLDLACGAFYPAGTNLTVVQAVVERTAGTATGSTVATAQEHRLAVLAVPGA